MKEIIQYLVYTILWTFGIVGVFIGVFYKDPIESLCVMVGGFIIYSISKDIKPKE